MQNGMPNGSTSQLPGSHSVQSSEVAAMNLNTFKPLLSKLLQRPQDYTTEDMRLALIHVVSGSTTHAQMGSFLASLRVTDIWRKPDMVQVLVKVLDDLGGAIKVGGEGYICDWTLTGESRLSVLNVALPAAIVAAGAGCRVVKTGNASSPWPATPSSGDILTALSVPTHTLPLFSLIQVASSRHVPFLHIYTPRYAPRFAAISPNPLRRELGFETIFHSLSSLVSPAKRDYCVVGVHEERLGAVIAEGLRTLGAKRAWVVYGKNGLDAISPEGESMLWDLDNGEISLRTISPSVFGVQERPLSSIQLPSNSDPDSSPAAAYSVHAKITASLISPRRLRNKEDIVAPYDVDAYGTAKKLDTAAIEDWVCMNAAALLLLTGKAQDEKSAFQLAVKTLKDGKAYHALEALRDAAALAVDVDSAESTD